MLAAVAEQPTLRALGLPPSLAGAKLATRGAWVRVIIAIGPARLHRIVERAAGVLRAAAPAVPPAEPPRRSLTPSSAPAPSAPAPGEPAQLPIQPRAAAPRGDPPS
jgi:hypothetical protein